MPRQPRPRRVKIVRYLDADGNRVPKGAPGARRVAERSQTFYATLSGKRVSLGTRDEGKAWANLNKLLRRRAEVSAGIRDDLLDHAERPLAEHVDDWLRAVDGKGTSAGQVAVLRAHLRNLRELAGWRQVGDITGGTLDVALGKLIAGPGRQRRQASARTRAHHLKHAKQFTRWLTDEGRLSRDPLRRSRPGPVEHDRRHLRRPPDEAEIQSLFAYLHSSDAKVLRGMTGPHRSLGYKVAMATGYRAGELRSLSRANFDLEAGMVILNPAAAKNRQLSAQPLPAWLIAELRSHFDAGGDCWEGLPASQPGKYTLRRDLKAAGIPYAKGVGGQQRYLDFHSFRIWYITELSNQPGISPKVLQVLARHSDPRLTLEVYAQRQERGLRAAADALPALPAAPAAAKVAPSTETGANNSEQQDTKRAAKVQPRKGREKKPPPTGGG